MLQNIGNLKYLFLYLIVSNMNIIVYSELADPTVVSRVDLHLTPNGPQ